MELIIKLSAITIISLLVTYFITTQVLKILGMIAKKGPGVIKGICVISGIILVLWIFSNPVQAEVSYEYWLELFRKKIGYSAQS